MLITIYVLYHIDENVFKEQYSSWENAYFFFEKIIKCNEQKFINETMTTWTNIDSIVVELENKESELFEINLPLCEEIKNKKCYQEYEIESDIQYLQKA